jgi:hypothetical protein
MGPAIFLPLVSTGGFVNVFTSFGSLAPPSDEDEDDDEYDYEEWRPTNKG